MLPNSWDSRCCRPTRRRPLDRRASLTWRLCCCITQLTLIHVLLCADAPGPSPAVASMSTDAATSRVAAGNDASSSSSSKPSWAIKMLYDGK